MTFHCAEHGALASLVHSSLAQLSDPIFAQLIALLEQVAQLFLNGNSSLLGFLQGNLKSICDALFFHQPAHLSGANGLVGSVVNNLGPQHS